MFKQIKIMSLSNCCTVSIQKTICYSVFWTCLTSKEFDFSKFPRIRVTSQYDLSFFVPVVF